MSEFSLRPIAPARPAILPDLAIIAATVAAALLSSVAALIASLA